MRSKNPELMLRIKEHIETYYDRYSSTPTVRDIASAMQIAPSTAFKYLVAMNDNHMISYENGVMSTHKIDMMTPEVNTAAIVGSIPCGPPDEREAEVEEYIPLSVSVFGTGSFYVLRASGDSMINADIDNGDLIVIREQQTAEIGDIVVAMTDDGKNTLKRLKYDKEAQSYYLHPENPAYEDIYITEFRVQGVASHVIKAL